MSERKLDHFSDESHLFSASTNIIITNSIKFFFFFSFDRFSLIKEHGVWSNNTEFSRISLNNLELDSFETTSDKEGISLLYRSVAIFEVRDQECLCQITSDTLNSVINWKNVDSISIRDVSAWMDLNDIAESHSQVVSDDFVHSDLVVLEVISIFDGETDAHSVSSLFTFEKNCISLHDFKLVHFLLGQLNNGIVVLLRLFNHKLVRGLLLLEDGARNIFLTVEIEQLVFVVKLLTQTYLYF